MNAIIHQNPEDHWCGLIMDEMHQGHEAFKRAGQFIIQASNEVPNIKSILSERTGISKSTFDQLERFALGLIDGRLIGRNTQRYTRLLKCPLDEQRKALDEGISVVECVHGQWQERILKLDELTDQQAQQVYHRDRFRTPAEQRTWLQKEQERSRPRVPSIGDYRITKKGVEFLAPRFFTWAELKMLFIGRDE